MPPTNFGPAPPSSRALLFSGRPPRPALRFPCTQCMADIPAYRLRKRAGASIYALSLRRRLNLLPRSAVSRHRIRLNLLPRPRSTANGVPSSLVRLPHFHRAPSSDGALFLCAGPPPAAGFTYAFAHGGLAGFAFVHRAPRPHKGATGLRPSSSLAALAWPCASVHGPKASLIPSSGAFLFQLMPAQNSWMRATAASSSAFEAA